MEATNLESFLQWGQQPEAEFPEFQYLHSDYDNGFSWDECLEEYLEPFALGDLPPVTERAETILGIDDVPELTREPTASDREVHNLSQSLVELQERVDSLENKLIEKQRKIDALEIYVGELQPFLQQLSSSIQEMQTKSAA